LPEPEIPVMRMMRMFQMITETPSDRVTS